MANAERLPTDCTSLNSASTSCVAAHVLSRVLLEVLGWPVWKPTVVTVLSLLLLCCPGLMVVAAGSCVLAHQIARLDAEILYNVRHGGDA